MTTKKLLDDCFLHDSDRLAHFDAIALLKSRITPIVSIENVSLDDASGRVAGAPVVARHPVPAHTNSAVDGYAFKAEGARVEQDLELPVAGCAAAGHPLEGRADPQSAVRIFTGAVLPDGLDSVVMQEDCELATRDGVSVVRIPKGLMAGANVRLAGEDLGAGASVFDTGHLIRPQDVSALASVGAANLDCFMRLRIGVVSTGDEVIRPGARALGSGEVFDANAPMLVALAKLTGGEVSDLGIWPDDPAYIKKRLAQAGEQFDVILSSGGASRGDEDHVLGALNELGTCHMWQLAIKPGRPLMFGQIGNAIMVGLPGNPVAVFVCFLMYVYPMLRRLSGASWPEPRRYQLPAAFEITKRKTGRREFWRGSFLETDGRLEVEKFSRDGSGLISGLTAADGLIDIPEQVNSIARGDLVAFIPFEQFGILGR